MLRKLFIQNYVLLERLELDFSKGLTIVTGETGAGKSILLGAASLILGERADRNALLDKEKKCIVEGTFKTKNPDVKEFLIRENLDVQAELILRREINGEGKSRAFVNDTPVTLAQLKELGELLVDIHSQHETLFLKHRKFQLSVLDAFAGTEIELNSYSAEFAGYKKMQSRLSELEAEEKKSKADLDYYRFLFDELNDANLKEGEDIKEEEELNAMTHVEEIKINLGAVVQELSGSEDSLASRMSRVQSFIQTVSKHAASIAELGDRLKSVFVELKDISGEAERVSDDLMYDPQRVTEIQERLNEIYRLEQKHHVRSVSELLALKSDFETKLKNIFTLDEELEEVRKGIGKKRALLTSAAKNISAKRVKAIPYAEKEIAKLLEEVNLPNAVLKIDLATDNEENFSADGIDNVRFLFSANKGIPLREIENAASGGELSRLMLCIKAAVAKLIDLPVMVFDEIDTGISGETALKVAAVLKQLSRTHQLIAITHLPQIAGRGDQHFFVYKELSSKRTSAKVKLLTADERVVEIAKMLSGDKPSAGAVENARELLRN